jgi:hypothetical protein
VTLVKLDSGEHVSSVFPVLETNGLAEEEIDA